MRSLKSYCFGFCHFFSEEKEGKWKDRERVEERFQYFLGETIEVGRAASKGRKKGHAGLSSPVAAYLGRMGGGRASMLYPHFSSQVPPLRPPVVATLLALGYPPGRASTHVLAHAY
ncbi:hypothetical protein HZH66_005429 [Vespula vulgaris]|uniref:Uncharacterized protein n=1 Tax=Vespula vulgaris TaxID=7454 RepID=A0A834KAL1_VESVU|nr:hypothetical protein HZH66_005429 [Vespula vulgaris]